MSGVCRRRLGALGALAAVSVLAAASVPAAPRQAKLTAPDGAAGDWFGVSVALDGNTALVGAHLDDDKGTDSGSAYVFTRQAGAWTLQAKLTAPDGAANDRFGQRVSLFGDTALIGAPGDDGPGGSDNGSAYVFIRQAGVWGLETRLSAPDPPLGDGSFGSSLALFGDTAVVGSPSDDGPSGANSGSAYLFTRQAGVWGLQTKLRAPDGAAGDFFGVSAALSTDTALVGAHLDDDKGANSGSAYVFTRQAGVWGLQAKLTALDGAAGDIFGISVALSGDTSLVGAYLDDGLNGADIGSAYVFTRQAGAWGLQAKLTAPDGAAIDSFGLSVALSGDTALVGAPLDRTGAPFAAHGSAYVFLREAGVWASQPKLSGVANDWLGWSVALAGDTALVGAPGSEPVGVVGLVPGSAYVFVRLSCPEIPSLVLTALYMVNPGAAEALAPILCP